MALFGGSRDNSLFRHLNRELMGDIITQQCAFYKHDLGATSTNMYGEASGETFYIGPVLFNCLIDRKDKTTDIEDNKIGFSRKIDFMLLRDDLVDGNYVPEVGDIVLYQEAYHEIHNIIANQLHAGKNPDYPNEINPLNPGLDQFGYNVSIICQTHLLDSDKPNITKERII